MTPDIKSLTCNVFSSQTDSFTGNSQQWVTYTWCLEMDDCAHQTCLIPCLSPHFPLSSVAPVSREVVKVPVAASCVRGGGKAAMCAPPSGHHYYYGHQCLGSVQPGETMLTCWVLREGSLYIYSISVCATLHSCHAKLQSTSSGCLSVKWVCFFIPLQCFVQTRVTECSSDNDDLPLTNNSSRQGLEGDLSYLPVSDGFVFHRQ